MWTATVVVRDPLAKDSSEVAFAERDQPVETLPADRPDEVAERAALRRSHGRRRDSQAHRRHGTVDRGCVDRIAIVDQKAMRSLARDRGAELLDRPLGGRMGSDVPVRDPARTDLQHDEDVQDSEAAGHRNEEVAGEDGVRVISDEGRPPLRGLTATRWPVAIEKSIRPQVKTFIPNSWR